MKKAALKTLLAMCVAALELSPSAAASKSVDRVIDLRALYKPASDNIVILRPGGNFMKTTDDTILFFNTGMLKQFLAVLSNSSKLAEGKFQVFSPNGPTSSRIEELTIVKNGDKLNIGAFTVDKVELDRLQLTPDWTAAEDFCRSSEFFQNPAGKWHGVSNASIAKLKNGKFLITGGVAKYPTKDSTSLRRRATVFDAQSKSVLKIFSICEPRGGHISMVMPDGKVLLVGNDYDPETQYSSMEIVDPISGTSHLLACHSKFPRRYALAACLDGNGNCLLLGGMNWATALDSRLVERVDVKNDTITRVGELKLPRVFNGGWIKSNCMVLRDGRVLVSGGTAVVPGSSADNVFVRKDAELVALEQ